MAELYNDYSVFEKIGLADEPVGVKFSFFRPENVPALEEDAAMSLCEMLRLSQKEKRAFYFSKDHTETCVGKILLGMEDMAPFAESGNIGQRLGVFNDARCNQHFYQFVPKLDRGITNYVSFMPISQLTEEPDVLVVAAKAPQAELVMRAMTWSTGEHYKSECTPVMGCAWLLLKPYKTQEVNFIVPALVHGPHGRELYDSDTLLIGIPYRWIPAIIKGLSEMPFHLEGHESKEKYYAEFEGILADLAEKAQNPKVIHKGESNLYKDIYAPMPDAAQYLKRIGIEEMPAPTRENLDKIVYAHLTHVPFENLDECWDKACPSLKIPDLYDKIVTRSRGGYCFELNAALYSLLQAIGYEVYPVACRILYGHGLWMPLSHRASIVTIDGVKHFVDVGYGGPSAHCAVPYNETVEGGFFIKTEGKDTKVMRKTADGEELIMLYHDFFFDPVDFVPLNFQVAMAPGSFFQMMPILNLTTDTGSKSINGDVYRCHHNGEVTEIKIENDEMMRKLMKEEFNLVK